MSSNTLLIKNMVCNRCIMAVEDILGRRKVPYTTVGIGEVHLQAKLNDKEREGLKTDLEKIGFELIDNRVNALIEHIKQCVIKRARNEVSEKERKLKLSDFLSAQLHHEYSYLSSLFSSIEGRTIENFFIEQRIEKVKELLTYDEMSLSQIALELEYSSTAHLSGQFKKVTGLTPSHFKEVGAARRKALDKV